ncbi:MAG: GNAT family protein [Coriobacteriia bacterium]
MPGTALTILRGTLVTLRPFAPADHDAVMTLLSHPDIVPWWGHYDDDRYRRDFLGEHIYVYVIEHADSFAGVIMFEEEDEPDYRHAAIDITVAGDLLEQGLGTDALRTLIAYLIDVRCHHRITIDPAVDNARAIHVYEKVGFRPVGVMRQAERGPEGWHDNLLMDLLAQEFHDPR